MQRCTTGRAREYRRRAAKLTAAAATERDADRSRHMLDLAATYQCAADQMAPQPDDPLANH